MISEPDVLRTLVKAASEIFEPKTPSDGGRIAYQDRDSVYVVDVSTGRRRKSRWGRMAAWFDDDTLIVAPTTDAEV